MDEKRDTEMKEMAS